MNPDKSSKRGCFIRKETDDTFTVVDYPTWSFKKYGYFAPGQNDPLPESIPAEQAFPTRGDALKFCAEENLVVCAEPHSKPVEVAHAADRDEDYYNE